MPANAMICRVPIAIQQRMECFVHVDVLTYARLQAVLLQDAQEHRFKVFPCSPLLTVGVQEFPCVRLAFPAEVDFTSAVGSAQLGGVLAAVRLYRFCTSLIRNLRLVCVVVVDSMLSQLFHHPWHTVSELG